MEPKWDPKQTKIENKNEDEKRRFRRSSWSRLGPILARLGGRLGVILERFVWENVRFREKRRFSINKVSKTTWGRSWVDLGAQEASK